MSAGYCASNSHFSPNNDTERSILVLQEDDHVAALLRLLLSREGYCVQAISDIENAVLYIENAPPTSLIMIDDDWLQSSTPSLLPILRNYPGWHTVPIIGLMRFYDSTAVERGIYKGVTDYLIQPFDPNTLLNQVQKYTG